MISDVRDEADLQALEPRRAQRMVGTAIAAGVAAEVGAHTWAVDGHPAGGDACGVNYLVDRLALQSEPELRSWNVARSRARRVLAAIDASDCPDDGQVNRVP